MSLDYRRAWVAEVVVEGAVTVQVGFVAQASSGASDWPL